MSREQIPCIVFPRKRALRKWKEMLVHHIYRYPGFFLGFFLPNIPAPLMPPMSKINKTDFNQQYTIAIGKSPV